MKIIIENREFELKANGALMKTYQEKFKESLIVSLYKMNVEKDPLACAKIIYCSADVEEDFQNWLESFKSPLFTLEVMPKVLQYISTGVEPTVAPKKNDNQKNVKKKMI